MSAKLIKFASSLLDRLAENSKMYSPLVISDWRTGLAAIANEPPVSHPIPLILTCPACCARHVDEGEFATKVHHTHACQSCGLTWRPAIVSTVGVRFLPGFGPAKVE